MARTWATPEDQFYDTYSFFRIDLLMGRMRNGTTANPLEIGEVPDEFIYAVGNLISTAQLIIEHTEENISLLDFNVSCSDYEFDYDCVADQCCFWVPNSDPASDNQADGVCYNK